MNGFKVEKYISLLLMLFAVVRQDLFAELSPSRLSRWQMNISLTPRTVVPSVSTQNRRNTSNTNIAGVFSLLLLRFRSMPLKHHEICPQCKIHGELSYQWKAQKNAHCGTM